MSTTNLTSTTSSDEIEKLILKTAKEGSVNFFFILLFFYFIFLLFSNKQTNKQTNKQINK